MKKKTSKAFRQRRRLGFAQSMTPQKGGRRLPLVAVNSAAELRRHRKGGVIEEPDLGCLFSSPCDPTNCKVSRVKEQCVPKRVYDDIGYFTTGPIAQEYFKQVPKKILTTKGPKALQNYCEKQSYTTCPTDTCRPICGCFSRKSSRPSQTTFNRYKTLSKLFSFQNLSLITVHRPDVVFSSTK